MSDIPLLNQGKKKLDGDLASLLPGGAPVEQYDPAKATYPKGRIGKLTIPMGASWLFFYAPTYILASANGTPVLPIAFSTPIIGIDNAKTGDIEERFELNFIGTPMIAENVKMPEVIKNYIELHKESLKKRAPMCAWDRLI